MGCKVVPIGKSVAILCSRGRTIAVKPCGWCHLPSEALCDEHVGGGKTCDARMCWIHRQRVGRDDDRCPDHRVAVPAQVSMFG